MRRWLLLLLALGTGLAIVHDWMGIGGPGFGDFVNGPAYDAVVVLAGAACLLRARDDRRERLAWIALAASVIVWAAGEIYWTLYIEGNPSAPFPSWADLGYLAFYPLAVAGLYLLVRARTPEMNWRLWLDAAIAALGTAALGAAVIFEFVAHRTEGTTVQVATELAYPLGDILLVGLVVGVVALTGWRPGRTWWLLLAGLVTMAAADVAFTLQAYGAAIPEGGWIEPVYLFSALFIGGAAWQAGGRRQRAAEQRDSWRELMVPGFFAAVMFGVFGLQYFDRGSALTTTLWAATLVAVLARLALSARENRNLLEQVQTDQLTGLGSRGRLETELPARCARAGEHPFGLVMLDLNGFKRYNDNFGHPTGDAMLGRLGAQLRAALGDDGVAYRVGGDEFVILLDVPDGRQDELAKRCAAAMAAKGRGFELSAAWGAAAVPEEARDPASAMQLADVRMYARKESSRVERLEDRRTAPAVPPQVLEESAKP
jgi:diguanylate cyclase (GGDEF)-like protein